MTWFRREPDVQWIERFGDEAGARAEAFKLLGDCALKRRSGLHLIWSERNLD
jgi:hypothetical protein